MESRIKMLREKRGLIQELLAVEIGVTQQMLSKYEKDITIIKVDVLKRIAEYFNVTTDYLLGLSDMKRDLLNNPVPVSLLSGDRKPQIRFLGNHPSGSGNLYHKSFRM